MNDLQKTKRCNNQEKIEMADDVTNEKKQFKETF